MLLAIGDVVLDRSDRTLGSVAGVASHPGGNLVALLISGDEMRLAEPYDLEVVARVVSARTTGVIALDLAVLAVATVFALVGAMYASDLGADWFLKLLAAVGGNAAVMSAFQWCLRLTGPRRFRV